MLHELARQAGRARQLSRRDRDAALGSASSVTSERRGTLRGGLELPPWLLKADIGAESQTILTSRAPTSAAAILESLTQLMDLLAARGLRPVVLIDDSDAWLQPPPATAVT